MAAVSCDRSMLSQFTLFKVSKLGSQQAEARFEFRGRHAACGRDRGRLKEGSNAPRMHKKAERF